MSKANIEYTFAPNGSHCVFYSSNLFRNARCIENCLPFTKTIRLEISDINIKQFGEHMKRLNWPTRKSRETCTSELRLVLCHFSLGDKVARVF